MLNEIQINKMLNLQASMNAKVNPEWLEAGYAYHRAIVAESIEAIEHASWKWWKHQEPDLAQVQMELVDIWHFALSAMLVEESGNLKAVAKILTTSKSLDFVFFDGKRYPLVEMQDPIYKLELMAGLAVSRRFDIALFASIISDFKMSWEMLYTKYIGKNLLNFFRQDFGYKDGSYVKVWRDGREDNEHLTEIIESLDPKSESFDAQVKEQLIQRYKTTVAG